MKCVEMTVLERDIEAVLKFLGRTGVMQFSTSLAQMQRDDEAEKRDNQAAELAQNQKHKIEEAATFLGIELPAEPAESSEPLSPAVCNAIDSLCISLSSLQQEDYNLNLDKERAEQRLATYGNFKNLNANAARLNDLNFLNLKIGHLEKEDGASSVKNALGERAVVIPLDDDGKEVLAFSSKKGRFALDSALNKQEFQTGTLPENFSGDSLKTIAGLTEQLADITKERAVLEQEKARRKTVYNESLGAFYGSVLMSTIIEDIRAHLLSTKNAYMLTGWLAAADVAKFMADIQNLTGGRVALVSYDPHERAEVRSGAEKIPISFKHGKIAKAFEPMVLSYGAPLYGSIDPTPITAFFFILLFAIMFGDVGQGLVLLLVGMAAGNPKVKALKSYRHFGGPMKIVGVASMFTGLLYGSVFANEELLEGPTHEFTGLLADTGFGKMLGIQATGKIIALMPEAGNITKLFYFFGFTIAVGVILNSVGLFINIMNKLTMRDYEKAIFSRTGIAGLAFFWYAISIAVRAVIGAAGGAALSIHNYDYIGLILPLFFIVTGPFWAHILSGRRPFFPEGIFTFIMEGIVEILETLSGFISNTVSFLRVGAFALSHAVLSFIIFTMAEKVNEVTLGPVWSLIVIIFGNLIIIVLEGMIVAIQVVRLQYYEFFGKFFTETGKTFTPFKFKK
jgi:V/A-type H+-transporting ATPase subunit I